MGDMADDAWASSFEQDWQEKMAISALRRKCNRGQRCVADAFYNDDGLYECSDCGRMTDV